MSVPCATKPFLRRLALAASAVTLIFLPSLVTAGVPAINLEEIVVHAQRLELIGEVVSASQGTVLAEQIENRLTEYLSQ